MRSRRKRLEESRMYLVIDKGSVRGSALKLAGKLSGSGVDMIQLRDKNSSKSRVLKEASLISRSLTKSGVIFIVNDYPCLARLSDSDGVHIGQSDLPIKIARRIVGKDRLIGVSCSNLKEALKAQAQGADYIGIGPVFRTRTKPGCSPIGIKGLKGLNKKLKIPVFAIGNINRANLEEVTSSGMKRIALCRAVLKAKDAVKAAQYFSSRLKGMK